MNRGDIILVNLPISSGAGREQMGLRPALIVHDYATSDILPVIMIIPFTTQLNALRYPYTIQIEPSQENGLDQTSILMVFQLRAIDRQRLRNKIGCLEGDLLARVDVEIRNLLGLSLS